MRWWGNNIRTWSGPLFPLLIMQLVVCAGTVAVNGVGLVSSEFELRRMVFVVAFGLLLTWWLATLVGVMRLRATERRAASEDGTDRRLSPPRRRC